MKLSENQDAIGSEGQSVSLLPIAGLGQITAGDSVSGRVSSLAEGQHGIRQSYQSFLSPLMTCQMRQRTVTAWQDWYEVKQL